MWTRGHSNWYHSKAWVGFLFAFRSNYSAVLYRLRDIATYWSKIANFYTPLAVWDTRIRLRFVSHDPTLRALQICLLLLFSETLWLFYPHIKFWDPFLSRKLIELGS